jgi:hypothetical protein
LYEIIIKCILQAVILGDTIVIRREKRRKERRKKRKERRKRKEGHGKETEEETHWE